MRHMSKELLTKSLAVEDLSAKEGHVLNLLVNRIKSDLESHYKLEADIQKGESIVKKDDNFKRLGYADTEVSMSDRYTRYVNDNEILRTQMTSLVPNLLTEYAKDPLDEKLWLCPGLVYRRDVIDKTHVGEPHQMDVWLLRKGKTNREDLVELVDIVVGAVGKILGKKLKYRYTETSHHYTEDGIEVEINYNGKWLEILECGLSGNKLLTESGLDTKEYSGLALGMGLDRLAMIAKNISDIRLFRATDERIQKQMYDLKKYKEVSKQPAMKRDMSIAVDKEIVFEDLCEDIRELLGDKAVMVEEVELKASTPYEQLPPVAVEKLGIKKGQSNWLVRIILRHPSRTIVKEEADSVYDSLYGKLHKGTAGYF